MTSKTGTGVLHKGALFSPRMRVSGDFLPSVDKKCFTSFGEHREHSSAAINRMATSAGSGGVNVDIHVSNDFQREPAALALAISHPSHVEVPGESDNIGRCRREQIILVWL